MDCTGLVSVSAIGLAMATQTASAATTLKPPTGQVELRPLTGLRPHPDGALLPGLGAADFRSLCADVSERGVRVPLEVNADGVVLDGHVRLRAALELGLEELPVRVVETADEREYMLLALLFRRHLNPGQRAAVVLEQRRYQEAKAAGAPRR